MTHFKVGTKVRGTAFVGDDFTPVPSGLYQVVRRNKNDDVPAGFIKCRILEGYGKGKYILKSIERLTLA